MVNPIEERNDMDGQALYEWGQEKVEEGAFDEWCWINVLYPEPWMIDDYDDVDYNEVAEKGAFRTRFDSDIFKNDVYGSYVTESPNWQSEVVYAECDEENGDWYVVAVQDE